MNHFPISPWTEIDEALDVGERAFLEAEALGPPRFADFLERFAELIEARSDELVSTASSETALAVKPRLAEIELPRTTDQLRQAASAARTRLWKQPILATSERISSCYAPIPGPVCVIAPNNFPLAFNAIGGGDFAAAVATGHPVIGKANPGHPATSRILAELAQDAAIEVALPLGFIQLIYDVQGEDGRRLVSDSRLAATAFTGSRRTGLRLKEAADATGNLIYLEMSSANPVVILSGAWGERGSALADELVESLLTGFGQFCTSPSLILTALGDSEVLFRSSLMERMNKTEPAHLLSSRVLSDLLATTEHWRNLGAALVTKDDPLARSDHRYPPSLMEVSAADFIRNSVDFQDGAFGPLSLHVSCSDNMELNDAVSRLSGSLAGSIYSATDGTDEEMYRDIASLLRPRVGRLLNDKMPTGVAVSSAMHHGGPFPSTGHPGFSAVGFPRSLSRFATLQCYDDLVDSRLPVELKASNPLGMVRMVDGHFTAEAVTWGKSEVQQ